MVPRNVDVPVKGRRRVPIHREQFLVLEGRGFVREVSEDHRVVPARIVRGVRDGSPAGGRGIEEPRIRNGEFDAILIRPLRESGRVYDVRADQQRSVEEFPVDAGYDRRIAPGGHEFIHTGAIPRSHALVQSGEVVALEDRSSAGGRGGEPAHRKGVAARAVRRYEERVAAEKVAAVIYAADDVIRVGWVDG